MPSLGPSWELNMDESIELTRRGEVRELVVINSPKAPCDCKAWFKIESEGFVWITKEGVEYDM